MPKNSKKSRSPRRRPVQFSVDDETGSIDDGISLCSNISDLTSTYDETETGYSTANESSDPLDDQLDAAIEDLRKKDSKTRENALRTLQTLFCQKFLSDLVSQRSENLVEVLLNSLKRGNEIERELAATVASLFAIQLGETNDELFQSFHAVLLPVIRDESNCSSVRAKFCQTLGLLCFLLSDDVPTTVDLLTNFEKIFSSSSSSICEVQPSALAAWCLLVTTLPTNFAHETLRLNLPEKLPRLIESADAELQNQAGEVIAILYEIAREIQSVFAEPSEELLGLLEAKANESAKYKGKKEKRIQRATFREILNSFEDGRTPHFEVKFGREKLEIDSWTRRFHYNWFSHLLSAGILVHLKSNAFLRSIFQLSEPEPEEEEEEKSKRFDRHLANKVAFKLRTDMLRKTRATKASRFTFDD